MAIQGMTMWDTGNWRPTPELRFATPPTTTTKPPQLQQLWAIDQMNTWGHVCSQRTEWRDVPLVVSDRSLAAAKEKP